MLSIIVTEVLGYVEHDELGCEVLSFPFTKYLLFLSRGGIRSSRKEANRLHDRIVTEI